MNHDNFFTHLYRHSRIELCEVVSYFKFATVIASTCKQRQDNLREKKPCRPGCPKTLKYKL